MIPDRVLVRQLEGKDWFFPVGNSYEIFDIVDSAVAQAERVGKNVGAELAV